MLAGSPTLLNNVFSHSQYSLRVLVTHRVQFYYLLSLFVQKETSRNNVNIFSCFFCRLHESYGVFKQMLSLQLFHLFKMEQSEIKKKNVLFRDSSFFNLCVVKWGAITLDTKECENNTFIMSLHATETQRTEALLWAVKQMIMIHSAVTIGDNCTI